MLIAQLLNKNCLFLVQWKPCSTGFLMICVSWLEYHVLPICSLWTKKD